MPSLRSNESQKSVDITPTIHRHEDWVESSILGDNDEAFQNTFCLERKESQLQVDRFYSLYPEHNPILESSPRQSFVKTLGELEDLALASDVCQIYCVWQKSSLSRLLATRELFDSLLQAYDVFSRIWDFIVPFGFTTRESDLSHAPFRFRQLEPIVPIEGILGSFECAYAFRYVVRNHREEELRLNPDYDVWSVRQTAVYQQYDRNLKKITIILIAPSEITKKRLEDTVNRYLAKWQQLNPFDLHRILISTLHENWRLYLRSLEKSIKIQSDKVTLTMVQREDEQLSARNDFNINFVDRQRLKVIEDKVLDLIIIFESVEHTLSQLIRQCESHCLKQQCPNCKCASIIEELEEQMHEAQVNVKKSDTLHKRVQGTAQLLSDLLDYENAQVAHLNERSLNGLFKESKDENSKMRILTERSTRDAAAVKILTVITLIYLPVTVVASIFSSQLIKVNEYGRISMIADSWWFALIAGPLTLITFVLWRCWLKFSIRQEERKHQSDIAAHEQNTAGKRRWLASLTAGNFPWENIMLRTVKQRRGGIYET